MAGDREYPKRPIVGVGAVVWKGDDVLLVRRGRPPLEGEWSLPGGAQDAGESVSEAACREVAEETGITIEAGPVVDVIDLVERDDSGAVRFHYTIIDLLARWQSGEPLAADDVAEARWVPLADLDQVDLWSETRRVILKAAAMRAGA